MELQSRASRLKTLRSICSSDQMSHGVCRSSLEESTERLLLLAREQSNLLHSLEQLERQQANPPPTPTLCHFPEPSTPPAALRAFLTPYGALLTLLRRHPLAVSSLLHHSGAPTPITSQLLMSSIYPRLWLPWEEDCFVLAASRAAALQMREGGDLFEEGSLCCSLLSSFLRVMPGGAAWLQAAVGGGIESIIGEGERVCSERDGGREGNREEGREEGRAGQESEGLQSSRACEALLEATLAALPAAPRGLLRLCAELRLAARNEGEGEVTPLLLETGEPSNYTVKQKSLRKAAYHRKCYPKSHSTLGLIEPLRGEGAPIAILSM